MNDSTFEIDMHIPIGKPWDLLSLSNSFHRNARNLTMMSTVRDGVYFIFGRPAWAPTGGIEGYVRELGKDDAAKVVYWEIDLQDNQRSGRMHGHIALSITDNPEVIRVERCYWEYSPLWFSDGVCASAEDIITDIVRSAIPHTNTILCDNSTLTSKTVDTDQIKTITSFVAGLVVLAWIARILGKRCC